MKAGLITFHSVYNYGANLQALALQTYINREICECEIIDFVPNNVSVGRPRGVRGVLSFGKRCAMKCIRSFRPDKAYKMERFQARHYRLSTRTYYGDRDVYANPPQYDLLISGSDQILNTTLSGCSETYYLKPWGNDIKKISYASSFGRENVSESEYLLIRSELGKFAAISARENSGARMLSSELNREIPMVVDPVFLLDRSEWIGLATKTRENGNYVFAYAMEYSDAMCSVLQRVIAEGKKVLLICGGESARRLPGEIIKTAGPDEFLSHIANAELVITNSFHGTAFSIIFEKPFISVAHLTRNARIESILDLIGSSEKMITSAENGELSDYVIDGREVISSVLPLIKKSKDYLKQNC